jgi:uncharacterized protein
MKLLIDIGHPAHVHLFKNAAASLTQKGWNVLFSVRKKAENVELLAQYGFNHVVYGQSNKSIASKLFSLAKKNFALFQIIKEFKPSITLSHSSFYLAQVSWFCRVPNITLEDTGNMEQILPYLPFTNAILTPASYHRNHGKKQIRYNGFHETAYIHPNFLKAKPDLKPLSPEVILIRLVDWTASHDVGHKGLSASVIQHLINLINNQDKVRILSEKPLPTELQRYALQIEPHSLHEYFSRVKLYIGEGASLASECALHGIPAIYINSRSAGVIDALEKAGLLYHFKSTTGLLSKVEELLANPDTLSIHKSRAAQFLNEKINLSSFLQWFIENYPQSMRIMKENPDYQYNFR